MSKAIGEAELQRRRAELSPLSGEFRTEMDRTRSARGSDRKQVEATFFQETDVRL
jgi:hypothetical protein